MQLSPLQLGELRFINVHVSPRIAPDLRNREENHPPFEFNNTRFGSTIEHICAVDDDASPVTNFVVTLALELPDDGENPPPYVVSIKCVGYFTIEKSAFPEPVKRYDVGVVNGASLLYGATRELLSSLTARGWYGPLLLPALNFQNNAPSLGGHEEVAQAEEVAHPTKQAVKKKSIPRKAASKKA